MPFKASKADAPRSPTVIFLHIPKTGGTTLHKILEQNHKRKQILTFDGSHHPAQIERFAKLPERRRARYRLIKGHLQFGFHRLVPGDSTYVTFLREPIARALSFYSHARTRSDHYLYRLLKNEKLDLRTLLEQRTTSELFNQQTHMIAGDQSDSDCSVGRSALETAKQNLQAHFSFVGLTEEFDASVVLLGRVFGWSLPFYVKTNVSSEEMRAEDIDSKTRALLREANALDLELYEFARTMFAMKRQAAGGVFESELRNFQRLN
jgi:hypothetical protein